MKVIENFPNYKISKKGIVFNKKNEALKPHISPSGYCSVMLYNGGKTKKFRLHRLVALYYLKNTLQRPYVNHKDGDKLNNDVSNLEWCTAKENTNHAIKTGLIKFKSGEKHKLSKTILAIDKNGEVTKYYGTRDVERKTGVLRKYVCRVLNKKRPHHKGIVYKYD